jgi:DNA-directed RNA polymerase specialized sigma24 family protein
VLGSARNTQAQYLAKPATHAQIEQFLASATECPLSRAVLPSEPLVLLRDHGRNIAEQVEKLAKTCSLTTIEVDLVDACLHGFSRKEYIEAHGVSVNTYKKRVRLALQKLSASSLDEVRDRLLRSL